MDALVMCGGRGNRLGGAVEREKPLVRVRGEPMVDRVLAALGGSRIERVHAVVSPHAPETAAHLRERADETDALSVVETAGEGYVADLDSALDRVGRPAVTVAADLPLLAPEHVDEAMDAASETVNAASETADAASGGSDPARGTDPTQASVVVCVPAALKRRLGASADAAFERDGRELAPTGLNVVAGGTDTVRLTYDARLAVNVNRQTDLELAEALCG